MKLSGDHHCIRGLNWSLLMPPVNLSKVNSRSDIVAPWPYDSQNFDSLSIAGHVSLG